MIGAGKNIKRLVLFIVTLILALPLLTGCPLSPNSTAPLLPQDSDLDFLVEDTFDLNLWEVRSDINVSYNYRGGEYEIGVVKDASFRAYWPLLELDNVVAQVNARIIAAPDEDAKYGLAFRVTDQGGYYFGINQDSYSISKMVQDEWHSLQSLTKSKYIKTDGTANDLRVLCLGNIIEAYVNGERLITLKDDTFTGSGKLALFAQSRGTIARFDNFTVYMFKDTYISKVLPNWRTTSPPSPTPTPAPSPKPRPTPTPVPNPPPAPVVDPGKQMLEVWVSPSSYGTADIWIDGQGPYRQHYYQWAAAGEHTVRIRATGVPSGMNPIPPVDKTFRVYIRPGQPYSYQMK